MSRVFQAAIRGGLDHRSKRQSAVTRVRKPPPQAGVSKPKFRIVVIFPRRIFFSPIDSLRAVSQSLPAFAPFTRGGSGSYDKDTQAHDADDFVADRVSCASPCQAKSSAVRS